VKFQCISVAGPIQLSSFANLLQQMSISQRRIRSLFLSTASLSRESEAVGSSGGHGSGGSGNDHKDDDSDYDREDGDLDDEFSKEEDWDAKVDLWYQLERSIRCILSAVAPTVITLELYTHYSREFFLTPVWLPHIVNLSLYGDVLEEDNDWQTYSMSKPLNTLRCLRLAFFDSFSSELFLRIKLMAPNLCGLHLPCHPDLVHDRVFEVALGRCEPQPVELRDGSVAVATLPSSVKMFMHKDWPLSPWVTQKVEEFERIKQEDTSGRMVFEDVRHFVKGVFLVSELSWLECTIVHKSWLERNEAIDFNV